MQLSTSSGLGSHDNQISNQVNNNVPIKTTKNHTIMKNYGMSEMSAY